MPLVYSFDHKHRRAPMEMKDLLGGKGANLAEMTSVLRLPVPPGFTITTDACRAYMASGWPTGLDEEVAEAGHEAREGHGPHARRPERPAAGQRPLGRQVLDARDDGHGPQPRPQRRSVDGLAQPTGDERFAFDSYRRFISMYGRIVLDLEAEAFDGPLDAAQGEGRGRDRRRHPRAGPAQAVHPLQDGRREAHRPALPAGADGPAQGRDRGRVPHRGTAPGRSPTAPGSASPTTSAPR